MSVLFVCTGNTCRSPFAEAVAGREGHVDVESAGLGAYAGDRPPEDAIVVASELGYDLSDPLWTARVLRDAPEAVAEVHRRYYRAGAQVATSAFVAVHPSRGLDVHAAQDVQAALLAARDGGCAVMLISDDLDEVLLVSDRIAVMYEGRVDGVFDRQHADRERLGLLMGGHASEPSAVGENG